MERHAFTGDWQSPYVDRKDLEVCMQICEDAKLASCTFMGDMGDWNKVSTRHSNNPAAHELILSTAKEELAVTREVLHTFIKRVKAKRWNLMDGNHEYRVWRAMSVIPQTLELLGLGPIEDATSILTLYDLKRYKVRYAGPYPHGMWLFEDEQERNNVWMEHGYRVSKEPGATARALIKERHASVVVGHCHRLNQQMYDVVGVGSQRTLFGVENGNLSILAKPEGAGIYTGIPHADSRYLNHQSGFTIIHTDRKDFWQIDTIHITNHKAVWGNREYRA